ncbi:MAG TPA: ATP-binding protein [Burkholderiaceae bacterium]|jgi:signal transduction histidine kinase|nr:ATP-binding protein [Burkholderiaceae bacterium]
MKHLRDLPIRVKLLGLIALSSMLSLLVAGAVMVAYDLVIYKRNSIASATTLAEIVGSISSAALAFGDRKAATEYLGTLRARRDIQCAALYTSNGQLFVSYQRSEQNPCVFGAVQKAAALVEDDALLVYHGVVERGERLGTVYLRANLDRTARVLRYTATVGAVLVGALLLGLFGSSLMRRSISQPLMEIAGVAQAVTQRRDYSLRAVKRGEDEIGQLTDAINQMLAQAERGAADLQRANERLLSEIEEHLRARDEVGSLNATLEQRVAERTQQLEMSNKELQSFSYSVSHDLRTPLRAIEGFSSALLRSHASQLDARGQDYLQRVRAATQRMSLLIDDLLSLARTARAEMKRREVDLSDLAQKSARELQEAHPERQVEFVIHPDLKADADPQLMRVVLDNLLGNAAKFSGKKPDARVEFGHTLHNGSDTFFVRDNGVGFDMNYAGKLFGVFQRLHSSAEFEGTGIGLANVHRVIARHGGTIWADSEPGRGATFFFTLPATPPTGDVHAENHPAGRGQPR